MRQRQLHIWSRTRCAFAMMFSRSQEDKDRLCILNHFDASGCNAMQPVEVHDLFAHLLRQVQVDVNSVLPCAAAVFYIALSSRLSVVNLSTGQPEVNARSWWSDQKTPSNSFRYDPTIPYYKHVHRALFNAFIAFWAASFLCRSA